SLFIIYFMYSLLVFLICGGLYSFFADIYLDNIHFRTVFLKYITGILTYLLGGFLIVGLFFVIMVLINKGINDLFVSGIFSVSILPSLLFYHISLLSKKTFKFIESQD